MFTENMNAQLVTALGLLFVLWGSKYLKPIKREKYNIPIWPLILVAVICYFIITGYISALGVFFIAALGFSAHLFYGQYSIATKSVSGVLFFFTFLALGFHLLPGFENKVLLNSQTMKSNSTQFTSNFNVDKTLAGIVTFLAVTPYVLRKVTIQSIALSISIALVFSCITLLLGKFSGVIEFNFDYLFDANVFVYFIVIQVISVCFAEEMFFRGVIQERLHTILDSKVTLNRYLPLAISSILFGLVHFGGGIGMIVFAIIAGVGYGLIYQLTRRVEFSIMAHVIFNVTHLILFSYPIMNKV